jgi:calcineurin-like phosphoesterase family protein
MIMSKRWVISDTHFGHANIMKYESRPFPSVGEMDWQMITRWNMVVNDTDKVYVLGDFALTGKDRTIEIIKSLKGSKHLIMGNHDIRSPKAYREMGFDEVSKYPIIIDEFVILSHHPVYLNGHMPYLNLYGHLHSKVMEGANYYNVGVELNNYTPVDLDKLIGKFKKLRHGEGY